MRKLLALLLLPPFAALAQVHGNPASSTTPAYTSVKVANGTCAAPSIAFSAATGQGFSNSGSNTMAWSVAGACVTKFGPGGAVTLGSAGTLGWTSGTDPTGSSLDTSMARRTAGIVMTTGTNAMQLSTVQTNPPTCSASCGTSPSVAGTDTAMIVTMGASGVPASPFTITFNGTWPAAPSCQVVSGLSTMVAGKAPIAVQTATTTITVTTNGTAPGTSDKYNVICLGVS